MVSFSQGSHESGESRLLVLKEEKYQSYFLGTNQNNAAGTLSVEREHFSGAVIASALPQGSVLWARAAPCNARGKYPRGFYVSSFEEVRHREKGPKAHRTKQNLSLEAPFMPFVENTQSNFQVASVCYLCHYASS